MDRKEGYTYAVEQGIISDTDTFFKSSFSLYKVKELNLGEKAILSLILSYTNRHMDFFISNNGIAELLGTSRTTIINLINSLKEKDLILSYTQHNNDTGNLKRFIKINKRVYNNLISKYDGKST